MAFRLLISMAGLSSWVPIVNYLMVFFGNKWLLWKKVTLLRVFFNRMQFFQNCCKELNLSASISTIILLSGSIIILIRFHSNVLTQILSRHDRTIFFNFHFKFILILTFSSLISLFTAKIFRNFHEYFLMCQLRFWVDSLELQRVNSIRQSTR